MRQSGTMLTREDDARLVALAKAGDVASRNTLIERHYGLIRTIVARAVGNDDVDEYLSYAIDAVIRAVNSFEPERGFRFMTFAAMGIQRECWRAKQQSGVVRIPVDQKTQSEESAARKAVGRRVLSIDAPRGDEDGASLLDLVAGDDEEVQDLDGQAEVERLREEIESLPAQMADVIRRQLDGQTLESIGDSLGFSRARAQQISAEARKVLAAAMRAPPKPKIRLVLPRVPFVAWCGVELDFLRDQHRAGALLIDTAKKIGRGYTSVISKATEIGLHRVNYWKPGEDDFLRANRHEGWVWCAQQLGRSANGVRCRALDIGIQFKMLKAGDRAVIHGLHGQGLTTTDIAAQVGVSTECIRMTLHGMGALLNKRDEKRRMRSLYESLAKNGCESVSARREQLRRQRLGVTHLPSSATIAYIALEAMGRPASAYEVESVSRRLRDSEQWKFAPKTWRRMLHWLSWLQRETPHVGGVETGNSPKVFVVKTPLAHLGIPELSPLVVAA